MTSMARGDNPTVHSIRGGRFVCTAPATAKCRNYPACECEAWSLELHGAPPAAGHEDQPQDECWIAPWLGATDLADSYGPEELILGDDEFPDGPIEVEWDGDCVNWKYVDETLLARTLAQREAADAMSDPLLSAENDAAADDLFTTFERLETCRRVEVTEENIHLLARHFGCSVDYSGDVPTLRNPTNHPVEVGSWIDAKGSRWNPEPLSQGWSPAGTFTRPIPPGGSDE